ILRQRGQSDASVHWSYGAVRETALQMHDEIYRVVVSMHVLKFRHDGRRSTRQCAVGIFIEKGSYAGGITRDQADIDEKPEICPDCLGIGIVDELLDQVCLQGLPGLGTFGVDVCRRVEVTGYRRRHERQEAAHDGQHERIGEDLFQPCPCACPCSRALRSRQFPALQQQIDADPLSVEPEPLELELETAFLESACLRTLAEVFDVLHLAHLRPPACPD